MSNEEWELIEGELSHVLGDSSTTTMATSAVAELLQRAGSAAAASQAQKEKDAADAKAKAAADTKAANYANDLANAQAARTTAQLAAMSAASESDPNGPLHQAAVRADADARRLEAKLSGGMMVPMGPDGKHGSSSPSFFTKSLGGLPVWGWGVLSIVTVGALVTVVKLASGPKSARR